MTSIKRRRVGPIDDTGYTEISIAVIGSVDSGKSSLVGTCISNVLDDGNGLSRSVVFVHPHERSTGRTSDISFQYLVEEESKRIITFIDLAGHEAYLRTTVSGLTTSFPDLALVCISDKITSMTKEHIGLCVIMDIPFMILFTKIDMVPAAITAALVTSIKKIIGTVNRKIYQIKEEKELLIVNKSTQIVPYAFISNKSGIGLNLVKAAIRSQPKCIRHYSNGFVVEHIYNVHGHGTVVSGTTGIDIKTNTMLFLGPFSNGSFIPIKVKSIHNDYRFDIDLLHKEKRGCLSINISNKDKQYLRKGMILLKAVPDNVCKVFKAKVKILHHHTTISAGYRAYANCGMIKSAVKFLSMQSTDGKILENIRSGDNAIIDIEFKHMNYIEPGQKIIFREHTTRAIGTILSIVN